MNTLDLVIPGLCGPLPDTDALQINPALSSLSTLLARADRFRSSQKGFHQELATLFGLRPEAPMPSAVLSLLGSNQELGQGYWFHADPVHLQADMDHAILRECSSLGLQQDETETLLDEINDHFREDGIRLIAVDACNWYLNVDANARIETTALHDVIGRNINFYLPKGEDEKIWKSFLNEVQMLFHMSEVNQRRERSGLFPVNSLWIWGGGEVPGVSKAFEHSVYTDHAMVKGLAGVYNARQYPLSDIESMLENISHQEPSLIVLDDVYLQACYGDIAAWQDAMDSLFSKWIEPVVSRAMSRKVSIRLFPCNGNHYLVSPANKYRFFRKREIRDHISTYDD